MNEIIALFRMLAYTRKGSGFEIRYRTNAVNASKESMNTMSSSKRTYTVFSSVQFLKKWQMDSLPWTLIPGGRRSIVRNPGGHCEGRDSRYSMSSGTDVFTHTRYSSTTGQRRIT